MNQELYSEVVLNLAASVGNPAIHGWEDVISSIIRFILMERTDLERIIGDFHFKIGVKEVEKKKISIGVIQIYHAYEFYRQCENVAGMKRCRDYLEEIGLETTIEEIGRLITEHGGGNFKYVKEFMVRLARNYSGNIEKGKIDEAVCDCFLDMEKK
ncbi:hypothetical protein HYX16_02245 [Candidatus Woesearchaeota archaeon]|nr:hypothetical protein [Candidatus Woesearchaeota archaeon]